MKNLFRAVSALCLAASAMPSMAEPLTTDSIISLAKTGIGDDAIIAKTGVMDKDRIAFDYTEVRPGVFKVEASNVAKPGEYGFIFALAGTGTGGAMTARIFDFSVQ